MIDRLFVIWCDLDESGGSTERHGRHIIGHLVRSDGVFRFWYDARLATAEAHGFVRFPSLPDPHGEHDPYEARYLFAAFAERIPSKGRADAANMLRASGVENSDDQFEILARTGGIRATDRVELAEYRAFTDDLTRPLEFRIAGRNYVRDAAELSVGDSVSFRGEPDNKADPTAVVVDRSNKPAGYVPRQYTALIGRQVEAGVSLAATVVRKLVVPDDAGKWVVRVTRSA